MAISEEKMTNEEYEAHCKKLEADPTFWYNVLTAIDTGELDATILPGKALISYAYRRDDDCQWQHEYTLILLDPATPPDERSVKMDFDEIEVELGKHDLPEIGWV